MATWLLDDTGNLWINMDHINSARVARHPQHGWYYGLVTLSTGDVARLISGYSTAADADAALQAILFGGSMPYTPWWEGWHPDWSGGW